MPPPALVSAFAPTGTLRATINIGNAVLAGMAPGATQPHGVSVDIASELARRLGVPVSFVVCSTAAKAVEAVQQGICDITFLAVDPARAVDIDYAAPYVVIEGAYMVKNDSPLTDNDQADKAGHRIAVGKGSAYDLFLTRNIKNATIVRFGSSQEVVDGFLAQGLEVAAGVKQQLELDARRVPGLRLLPGRFMEIRQAIGAPKGRGEEAGAWVTARDNAVYQTSRVFRLENRVRNVKISGLALGEGVGLVFDNVPGPGDGFEEIGRKEAPPLTAWPYERLRVAEERPQRPCSYDSPCFCSPWRPPPPLWSAKIPSEPPKVV